MLKKATGISFLMMGCAIFVSGYLYNKKLGDLEQKYLGHLTDEQLVNFNMYLMQMTTNAMFHKQQQAAHAQIFYQKQNGLKAS